MKGTLLTFTMEDPKYVVGSSLNDFLIFSMKIE